MTYTRLTKTFIGLMVFAAAGTIGDAVLQGQGWHPLLANCLRITVGTPEENQRCLAALKDILKR